MATSGARSARWVGLPVGAGERLLLDPASLSILGNEHGEADSPVIALWNERPGTSPSSVGGR